MLFVDDVILIDEMHNKVNAKLKVWRRALETKGFWLNRTKTEYLEFNFGDTMQEESVEVSLDTQVIPKKIVSSTRGL